MAPGVMTFDKMLNDFSRRLYTVEQLITDPAVSGSNEFPDGIIIGEDEESVSVIFDPPNVPENLSAETGAFFDTIYADLSWDPPTYEEDDREPTILFYEVEVARKISGVYQTAQIETTAGEDFRIEPLDPETDYGFRLRAISNIGRFSDHTDWLDFTTGKDETVPDPVTGVVIARGATSAIVKFNASTAVDVAGGKGLYEIQIDTVNTFNSGNLRTVRTTATVFAFNDISSESTWYARVAPIDSSGNQGAYVVSSAYTAGGVNDSMIINDLSAAKITVGVMHGDRVDVNTLNANRLTTSSLTAANITLNGGSLRAGNPPTTGLLINSQGIRLYAGGVTTVTLDAATGSASFTGNIASSSITGGTITGAVFQTASFGARLVIDQSNVDRIKFYDSSGTHIASFGEYQGGFTRLTSYGLSIYKFDGTRGALEVGNMSADYATITGGTFYDLTIAYPGNSSTVKFTCNAKASFPYGLNAGSDIFVGGSLVYHSGNMTPGYGYNSSPTFYAVSAASVSTNIIVAPGLATNTGNPAVIINPFGGGQFYRDTGSSKRWKRNIQPAWNDGKIHKLNVRFFQFDPETENNWADTMDFDKVHIGFIAEEVAKVDPAFAFYDDDGKPSDINWRQMTVSLVAEVQDMRKEIDSLKAA